MNINILSVDWDYFFPNADPYDWGHKEELIFLETIWPMRWSGVNLQNGRVAKNEFRPSMVRLDAFWHKLFTVKGIMLPHYLVVTESHKDLYQVITEFKFSKCDSVKVWNYDAHHDMGYDSTSKVPACDNWAKLLLDKGKLSAYTVVYPDWRRREPESDISKLTGLWVNYSDDEVVLPAYFNVVFICRSSAWTPSWHDDAWMDFIEYWEQADIELWEGKMGCEYALKPRKFNTSQAKELERQINEWRR